MVLFLLIRFFVSVRVFQFCDGFFKTSLNDQIHEIVQLICIFILQSILKSLIKLCRRLFFHADDVSACFVLEIGQKVFIFLLLNFTFEALFILDLTLLYFCIVE